ncbi:Chaperone protein HtpG [Dyadobacter sp. CECT 9623]|uniref:Chaperone protein HtpG n=1 Tax=Dyadobacter linearis TaxID=2823330 RepID=A0ABM8UVL0_9BACT|nr:molecular chaperone HtpG [Dyadobacter sp. CECT 9623]CAG5072835.1 Chaperone protein HtpG [Dyadobacter sp. CECT 9623]
MESVIQEKGNLSIHTENIFPIIKKFLYSDHEIFLRELVSNAVDASQKIKKLASYGEFNGELGELKVVVKLDKEAKTITISDNGIGMTADEIKKYINQIAFSGATEFVEKYKDKGEDGKGDKGIIGHFGLGFYSAYMVAQNVEIITKSYKEGSEAVRWQCDGSTEFELSPAEKESRGSDIILHVAADSEEFLDEHRLRGILEKYGKFLPIAIEFEEKTINNPNPVWTKNPADLTDEDYLSFYKELYPYSEDPLFWIHLNVDYPFNLTGVLYFPKLKNDFQGQREKIQLYSRQVFITDEVKDIVPDFLQLMHGVIDSPDIPLNVSRSYLQADGNVKKINGYITRKVADKLSEIFKNDREGFEKKFDDIGLFVKYGIISDDKFYEKAKDFCLLKNTDGKFFTFEEYRTHVGENQTDKNDTQIWLYTTDEKKQDAFIQSAKKRSYDVLELSSMIDSHFINALEQKLEKINVKRVDADTLDKLVEKDVQLESILSADDQEKAKKIFEEVAGSKSANVLVEPMPVDELPVVITFPEFMRRMTDMQASSGQRSMFGDMPLMYTVSLNSNHPVIGRILSTEDETAQKSLAKQVYDLALLSQGLLSGSDLTQFIQRTVTTL